MIDDPPLSLVTRLWFAWLCFFRVLFDGRFAAVVWGIAKTPALASSTPSSKSVDGAPAEGDVAVEALDAARPEPDEVPLTMSSPPAVSPTSALQLLSLLQREGRLVDFLQQDITAFPDADVGTAARVVHEGCRRALRAHAEIEPVLGEEEGARVQLAAGFDADEVKLVGDVRGEPPYAGVLRHCGWRATKLELPQIVGGHDENVLAPAEVEVG